MSPFALPSGFHGRYGHHVVMGCTSELPSGSINAPLAQRGYQPSTNLYRHIPLRNSPLPDLYRHIPLRNSPLPDLRQDSSKESILFSKGPEIRTDFLKDGKPIQFKKGQAITMSTDYNIKGNENILCTSYKRLKFAILGRGGCWQPVTFGHHPLV